LSFRYEKELNRVVVKVIDPETGELVREVPPEAVIKALKQLRETAGHLVDAEA
jgi:flagellar protein FlaG